MAVLVLGLLSLVVYVLVPQLSGVERSLEVLGHLGIRLVLLAVAVQIGAFIAQAALLRAVLPADSRPRFVDHVRIEFATTAVSHTVPGGTAAGTAIGFRLLRRAGVAPTDAGFAVAARGFGGAVVLNVLLWLALVVSIPDEGFHPLYTPAAALGILLLAALGTVILLLAWRDERAARVVAAVAERVPRVDAARAVPVVERLAERFRDLTEQPTLLARAILWSTVYWIASAASLWVLLAAAGDGVGVASTMVAFGLSNVLAFIPVTPRGLGVVEGTLIPLLIAFGADGAQATVAVLAWRLANFWLPIPVGGLAYLSLRKYEARVPDRVRRT